MLRIRSRFYTLSRPSPLFVSGYRRSMDMFSRLMLHRVPVRSSVQGWLILSFALLPVIPDGLVGSPTQRGSWLIIRISSLSPPFTDGLTRSPARNKLVVSLSVVLGSVVFIVWTDHPSDEPGQFVDHYVLYLGIETHPYACSLLFRPQGQLPFHVLAPPLKDVVLKHQMYGGESQLLCAHGGGRKATQARTTTARGEAVQDRSRPQG
jgi:hypothetical protein